MESTLGKRISAYRKQMGLTQDQLAEKLGLTAQAVSKWENDLSCPDITILPKLADIFGVSTDALLGHETEIPVCETRIVTENNSRDSGFTYDSDSGKMDFHWEGAKLEGICLACWVLLTGAIYLVAQLLNIPVTFWNTLWPTFLLVFGLFGLYPKFSAFRLGCGLVGGYFLVEKLHIWDIDLDGGIWVAVAVLLFGIALLADALRKRHKSDICYTDSRGHVHHGKMTHDYTVDGNRFTYDANFGSNTQLIQLDTLQFGEITTNFGEYTVDLTGVVSVEAGCRLNAECNFGELTILVPRRYTVLPDSSTSFASFEIKGQPDSTSAGTISMNACVSFGEISIKYI